VVKAAAKVWPTIELLGRVMLNPVAHTKPLPPDAPATLAHLALLGKPF
jgi:hypothetical protein